MQEMRVLFHRSSRDGLEDSYYLVFDEMRGEFVIEDEWDYVEAFGIGAPPNVGSFRITIRRFLDTDRGPAREGFMDLLRRHVFIGTAAQLASAP